MARRAAEQRTFQARFGLFLLTVCSLLGAEEGSDLKYSNLLKAPLFSTIKRILLLNVSSVEGYLCYLKTQTIRDLKRI